jgi:hypothetical protein
VRQFSGQLTCQACPVHTHVSITASTRTYHVRECAIGRTHECRVTDPDARACRCERALLHIHSHVLRKTNTRVLPNSLRGREQVHMQSQHAGFNGQESVPACGGQRASWRNFCPWRPCRRQLLSLLQFHTTHRTPHTRVTAPATWLQQGQRVSVNHAAFSTTVRCQS